MRGICSQSGAGGAAVKRRAAARAEFVEADETLTILTTTRRPGTLPEMIPNARVMEAMTECGAMELVMRRMNETGMAER